MNHLRPKPDRLADRERGTSPNLQIETAGISCQGISRIQIKYTYLSGINLIPYTEDAHDEVAQEIASKRPLYEECKLEAKT